MRKRWIQVGKELVPAEEYLAPAEPVAPMVMPDIAPYKSMVTGEQINSRSRHREHLRDHGMTEIGNEVKHLKPYQVRTPSDEEVRGSIVETMYRKGYLR